MSFGSHLTQNISEPKKRGEFNSFPQVASCVGRISSGEREQETGKGNKREREMGKRKGYAGKWRGHKDGKLKGTKIPSRERFLKNKVYTIYTPGQKGARQ